MTDDLFADNANVPNAEWDVMLKRGFRKRCARCGAGGQFVTWFRMKERCDSCGFKFDREEGYFVGVYFINFAVTEIALFLLLMGVIVLLSSNSDVSLAVPMTVGAVLAVMVPIAFYPFAKTIWSAIDLTMTPLELPEIIAARDHLNRPDDGRREGEGDSSCDQPQG